MDSPLIVLNSQSSVPPYEQIRAQLCDLIAARHLAPGAELPSVRQLARDLNVAPNTIVRAYGELERGGWIVSSQRRGFRVGPSVPVLSPADRMERLRGAVKQLLLVAQQLGATMVEVKDEIDRQIGGSAEKND